MTWTPPESTLLLTKAGSHAYGTNNINSDEDYRGIIYATRDMLLGLSGWDTQITNDVPDVVLYTLPKFVKLALNSNPNVIEILYVAKGDVLKQSAVGRELRAMRAEFLSQRAMASFTGYAHAQLKRMTAGAGKTGYLHDYDTKNAMHLVRLYRMGYELLTEGVVNVRRSDAEELINIRNGAWSLNDVINYANDMDLKCHQVVSSLPPKPNTEYILEWLMETQLSQLNQGNIR